MDLAVICLERRVLCLGLLMTFGLVALFTGAGLLAAAFLFTGALFAGGFLLEEAGCFFFDPLPIGDPIRSEAGIL